AIAGKNVAFHLGVCGVRLRSLRECQEGDLEIVALKKCRRILFGGRPRGNADFGATKLKRTRCPIQRRQQEPLTVKIVDTGKFKLEFQVARHRPGGVQREEVDATVFEGFETSLWRQRPVFDLSYIAEHSGCDGLAKINVESPPNARTMLLRKSWKTFAYTADKRTSCANVVQSPCNCARGCNDSTNPKRRGDT